MEKEKLQEKLENEFVDFAIEYPQSALSLITGLFVGLIEHSVRSQGEDETLELKIKGLQKRNITIHKVE